MLKRKQGGKRKEALNKENSEIYEDNCEEKEEKWLEKIKEEIRKIWDDKKKEIIEKILIKSRIIIKKRKKFVYYP